MIKINKVDGKNKTKWRNKLPMNIIMITIIAA